MRAGETKAIKIVLEKNGEIQKVTTHSFTYKGEDRQLLEIKDQVNWI